MMTHHGFESVAVHVSLCVYNKVHSKKKKKSARSSHECLIGEKVAHPQYMSFSTLSNRVFSKCVEKVGVVGRSARLRLSFFFKKKSVATVDG